MPETFKENKNTEVEAFIQVHFEFVITCDICLVQVKLHHALSL